MLELIQQHTSKIYELDGKRFQRKRIPARELLVLSRFDLFAKLIYIKYRENDKDLALKIYSEHIKAFNPDFSEPGRTDKNGLQDFISAFDKQIDFFREKPFDPSISLIPVSANGVILDGSHRVAALAYFNKDVDILQFEDVYPKADFNYSYFLNRGLKRNIVDKVVLETLFFIPNLYVAFLWPSLGSLKDRELARDFIRNHFDIFYVKELTISLKGLTRFFYEIYNHQDWVGNKENNFAGARYKAIQCYGKNKTIQFVIFQAKNFDTILQMKEKILLHYQLEENELIISENYQETKTAFDLIFTSKVELFNSFFCKCRNQCRETIMLLKSYYLTALKIKIFQFLNKLGVRIK